jgi:AbrB family looped-hinge helix DNA binding protein
MAIVTVKNKYQVVIPKSLRDRIGVNVGDILEARVERGRITFTPKTLVEPGIAQSLAEFKQGQANGPFRTAADLGKSLARESKRLAAKKSRRAA